LKSFVFGVLLAIFQSNSLCFEVYRVQAGEGTPSSLGRPDRSHKGPVSNASSAWIFNGRVRPQCHPYKTEPLRNVKQRRKPLAAGLPKTRPKPPIVPVAAQHH
jgi:hypothetical protein